MASPKTVANWSATCYYFTRDLQPHEDMVEYICQNLDVSSRAAAAIFAMQHDLLGGPGEEWH